MLDIGGFTTDYLLVKNGEADLSACDSLDNGVITLYNGIKSKVNADFDILLDESDIDAVLKDIPTDFDESVIRIVQEQAQQFINDLFGKLRERMIDLRSGKAVFVGGGSILLKKQIEASGKVGAPIFVDEISANTKGYELLFKAACMGRCEWRRKTFISSPSNSAAEIRSISINRQGRRKAQFLVNTVLHYIHARYSSAVTS